MQILDNKLSSIEYFSNSWNNSKKYYTMEERFWNQRAEEFNRKDIQEKENIEFLSILDFIEVGQDTGFENVLDIGCGTGFYSIQFSQISEYVIATDISEHMITYAKNNSKEEEINNIAFVKKPWSELNLEDFGCKEKFDLVFASMSPAIDSYEDLMKMIDYGRNLYFLSGFVEKKDNLKDELSKIIFNTNDTKSNGNKIYSAFNILWNMGYHPKISYKDSSWERLKAVDELYSEFLSHFERTNVLTQEDKSTIKDYLKNKAVDGMVQEKTKAKIAWLCWRK